MAHHDRGIENRLKHGLGVLIILLFLSFGELCLDGLGVAFFCFPLLDPAGLVDSALPGDLEPSFFCPGRSLFCFCPGFDPLALPF